MAPRSEEQYAAIREESATRILEAALTLFARFGVERTSVRMIAREAGVSQGLLYNYFDGKDDLVHALFARSLADVRASFARLREPGDPAERLAAYIRHSFEILREHQDFWRLFYGLRMQPAVLAGLQGEVSTLVAEVNQTLAAHLRALGTPNPSIRAATLFALIDGAAQHYTLDPGHYPLDEVIAEIIDIFCSPA